MKYMIAAVAAACALTCANANAATFDFSYDFNNGGVIEGSLDGTVDGSFIDDISNVHMTFQGLAFDQPLVTASYLPNGSLSLGTPIVSFDATQNDFAFGNSNSTEYLIVVGSASAAGAGASEVETIGPLGSATDEPMNSSWSITPAPVPLPAAVWLLSSGVSLLGAWGRRKAA
jgi:hypothetical protein